MNKIDEKNMGRALQRPDVPMRQMQKCGESAGMHHKEMFAVASVGDAQLADDTVQREDYNKRRI